MFKSFEKTHNLNSEILGWKYYWERKNERERSVPQDSIIYLHLLLVIGQWGPNGPQKKRTQLLI